MPALADRGAFDEVLELIDAARRRAYQAVNNELVGLCWKLGEYISKKIASAEWGDSVVEETHHLIILGQTKRPEEREFYMLAATRGRWTKRELERQIRTGAAHRSGSGLKKVSPAVTQIRPTAAEDFKNEYSLEDARFRRREPQASPAEIAQERTLGTYQYLQVSTPVMNIAQN